MRYKNLLHAYLFEIFFGLVTSILIIIIGFKAIVFYALFALRPFILEKEHLAPNDEYWHKSFHLLKNSLTIFSLIIIVISIVFELLGDADFLIQNKERILHLIIPFYVLVHGLTGVFTLRNNS